MADRKDDESDDRDQDELDEPEGKSASEAADAKRPSAKAKSRSASASEESASEESASEENDDDDDSGEEKDDAGAEKAAADEPAEDGASTGDEATDRAARTETDADDEEEILPTQLGTQRYVFAAFFGGIIIFAYVLGKLIHGVWGWAANREWFYGRFPALAAVPDDSKTVYGLVVGAVIALVLGIRTIRKPDVRRWTDDVTAEMTKVKWPTRKEVYASTVVVIAGSLIACAYLFLLDQFWSFVTGLIYGTGS